MTLGSVWSRILDMSKDIAKWLAAFERRVLRRVFGEGG